jgi:hypothetical protein
MKKVDVYKKKSLNLRSGEIKLYRDGEYIKSFNNTKTSIKAKDAQQIHAAIQFCSSNKVKITENTTHIELTSFMTNRSFVIVLSLILAFTLIALLTDYKFLGLVPFIIILYPLYFITLGRNRYLKLIIKEKKY